MFEDDAEAWGVLEDNFKECAGVIFSKVDGREPTEEEWEAIDYLCDEWDYDFDEGGARCP